MGFLAAACAVDAALGPSLPPTAYREISAEQCKCWAANHAPLANVLDAECHLISTARVDRCGGLNPADRLVTILLATRRLRKRNKAAGTALELFYHLAGIRLQREVLGRSLREADQAIANSGSFKSGESRCLATIPPCSGSGSN